MLRWEEKLADDETLTPRPPPDLCLLWVGKVNGLVKCQELGSWGSACLIKPSGHLQTALS